MTAQTQCNRSSPDQDSCSFSSPACAFTCPVFDARYAGCAAGIAHRYVDDVGAPNSLARPSQQFPGHVCPGRGAQSSSNPLLLRPFTQHLPPQDFSAHHERRVCHGEISSSPVQSGRRLRDQLPLCEDGYVKVAGSLRDQMLSNCRQSQSCRPIREAV